MKYCIESSLKTYERFGRSWTNGARNTITSDLLDVKLRTAEQFPSPQTGTIQMETNLNQQNQSTILPIKQAYSLNILTYFWT